MKANSMMNQINEKRASRRILAVCRVLDSHHRFLGFTLDLTNTGLQIIVNKNFPPELEFEIILSHAVEDKMMGKDLKVKVLQMWRSSTNEEFDQIGGKFTKVELPEELKKLINYCDQKAKERYQFDLEDLL